jgi:hypothetical protein
MTIAPAGCSSDCFAVPVTTSSRPLMSDCPAKTTPCIFGRDNDPKRDLKAHGIVRAIANLLAAGIVLADQYVILNHWR